MKAFPFIMVSPSQSYEGTVIIHNFKQNPIKQKTSKSPSQWLLSGISTESRVQTNSDSAVSLAQNLRVPLKPPYITAIWYRGLKRGPPVQNHDAKRRKPLTGNADMGLKLIWCQYISGDLIRDCIVRFGPIPEPIYGNNKKCPQPK